MQKYDIAVIGGGASGLVCAVRLKELDKNLSVAVIEKGERAGKKIAASGNGQGNVSNVDLGAEHYRSITRLKTSTFCSRRTNWAAYIPQVSRVPPFPTVF